jgi:ComF family protein
MAGLVPMPGVGNKGWMGKAVALGRGALRHIIDFALPPRCAGCGAITDAPHRFCLGCWQMLTFIGPPCCERCGLPFAYDQGEGAECGACLAAPPALDRLRAAVAYDEIARTAVLKLKYGGQPGVAATLAWFMRRHLGEEDKEAIVAPVPLHRWRIWKRGFNQSALIAQALVRDTDMPIALDLMHRVKSTPPMKGMSRNARALNVRGAFAIDARYREAVRGKTILLIDDVYTSGATANACAKILKRSGAARVNLLCWARVVHGADD